MSVTATLDLETAARRGWDTLVVGAGPAGSLAARELARHGRTVLLVDRSSFPRWKVCGCCLNLRARDALARAGLGALPEQLGGRPLTEILVAARGCRATIPLPGGVAVSREAFDRTLIDAAISAGAHFLPDTNAVLGACIADRREVTLTQSLVRVTARTKLVLAADGLGGRLLAGHENFVVPPDQDSRIGAGVVVESPPCSFRDGIVYMACGRAGYVGMVLLEDGRLDVAAAFDRDGVRRAGGPGSAASAVLAEVGWSLPNLAILPWRGTAALTRRASRLFGERVLVLGDAAGYVEPFTGEGMAWALASAIAIAPLALQGVAQWEPAVGSQWERVHRRVVTGRQAACRIVARALRHPILARTAIHILSRMPSLAAPVVRRLNSAPVVTKGIS
jgi:flavin-dependent dehydrogenase